MIDQQHYEIYLPQPGIAIKNGCFTYAMLY